MPLPHLLFHIAGTNLWTAVTTFKQCNKLNLHLPVGFRSVFNSHFDSTQKSFCHNHGAESNPTGNGQVFKCFFCFVYLAGSCGLATAAFFWFAASWRRKYRWRPQSQKHATQPATTRAKTRTSTKTSASSKKSDNSSDSDSTNCIDIWFRWTLKIQMEVLIRMKIRI